MVKAILKRWSPNASMYHLKKKGGHVAAMRPHIGKSYHASVDLTNFFGSVSRTKVHRALMKIGFRNRQALDIASESCVELGGRKFLPYGFPQSMILASLVLEKSVLGATISDLRASGTIVTVYVDDILLSAETLEELREAYDRVLESVVLSGFEPSVKKSEPPSTEIHSFNCRISDRLEILEERMERFKEQVKLATPRGRAALLRYVGVINGDQARSLASNP